MTIENILILIKAAYTGETARNSISVTYFDSDEMNTGWVVTDEYGRRTIAHRLPGDAFEEYRQILLCEARRKFDESRDKLRALGEEP